MSVSVSVSVSVSFISPKNTFPTFSKNSSSNFITAGITTDAATATATIKLNIGDNTATMSVSTNN